MGGRNQSNLYQFRRKITHFPQNGISPSVLDWSLNHSQFAIKLDWDTAELYTSDHISCFITDTEQESDTQNIISIRIWQDDKIDWDNVCFIITIKK